ncbi:4-oxalocrotonate tautomerase [Parageobacillus sp. KH3-4]|uniref:4-oxalocrotonate tautomerase n=1 Tax=Parageobacillus sp. KH3-4 TaxID=2916802 RepID=UPI001FCC0896|nr:4-oxalocrotonate tautomerase [Parageobacillus sp. KH3-4]
MFHELGPLWFGGSLFYLWKGEQINMPFIQVYLLEGRPPEKKEALIYELTETVRKVLGAPRENVRVMIQEMPLEHWGIAGESVKKQRKQEKE